MNRYTIITVAVFCIFCFSACNVNQTLQEACSDEDNCVFTYVGNGPCASCDYSDEEYACVSKEFEQSIAESWQEEFGDIACEPCMPSPKIFHCTCDETICYKTAACETDIECDTDTYGEDYSCVGGECRYVGVTILDEVLNEEPEEAISEIELEPTE